MGLYSGRTTSKRRVDSCICNISSSKASSSSFAYGENTHTHQHPEQPTKCWRERERSLHGSTALVTTLTTSVFKKICGTIAGKAGGFRRAKSQPLQRWEQAIKHNSVINLLPTDFSKICSGLRYLQIPFFLLIFFIVQLGTLLSSKGWDSSGFHFRISHLFKKQLSGWKNILEMSNSTKCTEENLWNKTTTQYEKLHCMAMFTKGHLPSRLSRIVYVLSQM